MKFKKILVLILILPLLVKANEVQDYKAEYLFETEQFSVTGIREFKTDDNKASITFDAKTKIIKLFFESTFDVINNQVFSEKYLVTIKAFLIKRK